MTSGTLQARTPSPAGWRFRPDIEGLRALAVLAVLGYHAGVPWMGGGYVGVDVFFVISGFLITGLLADEFERTGTLDLIRFYARRVRRLLPASAATLVGTAALTLAFLPINRWASIAGDIFASALYFVNWRLADRAVDYLASEAAASPVQHFWSLAVEEQYYLIWPVVIGIGVLAARKANRPGRPIVTVLIMTLLGISLVWSVLLTASDPGRAYFVTPTRVWELAIGAALALIAPRLPAIGRLAASLAATTGLLMIWVAVTYFSSSTSFPGWLAAIPTLGAAAVIAAGSMRSHHPLVPLLGHPAAQWIGARSYSLYLWHWPFIVALEASVTTMTVPLGLLAVAVSVLPAMASYRWVENPIRRSKRLSVPSRAFSIATLCTAIGVLAAGSIWISVADDGETVTIDTSGSVAPLAADEIPSSLPTDLVPSLASVADDIPDVYERGCHVAHGGVKAISCEYGDTEGPVIVLVGDSHAAQWVPAFAEISERQGWHLFTMSKSACPYIDALFPDRARGGEYEECIAWNQAVTDRLIDELQPELVVTTSRMSNSPLDETAQETAGAEADQILEAGLVSHLQTLTQAGIEVAVLRDTPLPIVDVPDCLGKTGDITGCSTPRDQGLLSDVQQRAVERVPGVTFIDLTDWICTSEICPSVVASMLVWRDQSHLSTVYARKLGSVLTEQLPVPSDS